MFGVSAVVAGTAAAASFDNPHQLVLSGSGGPIEYDISIQTYNSSTPDPEGADDSLESNDEYDDVQGYLRGTVDGGVDKWKLENPVEHDGQLKGHQVIGGRVVNNSDNWARLDLTWDPSDECSNEYRFNVNHRGSGDVNTKFVYPCECSVRANNGGFVNETATGDWEVHSELNDDNPTDDFWVNGRMIEATIGMSSGSGVQFYNGPRP